MMINRSTMNYRSRRDPQHALRVRMRELAASRVRFGYRRLTVMLRREGWAVNAKRIYRLYTDLQCGPRCARKSRGVAARRRSEPPGPTKSGRWILSPPGCSMDAGSGC
jgi:putative transposase